MRRDQMTGRTTEPHAGSFGNLYRARRVMMATIREHFPDVRFFDPIELQRWAPNAYAVLTDFVSQHGRLFAECIFYETAGGVSVAFVLTDGERWP